MSELRDDVVWARYAERQERQEREEAERRRMEWAACQAEIYRRLQSQLIVACQKQEEKEIISLLKQGAQLSPATGYEFFVKNPKLTELFLQHGHNFDFTGILITSFDSMRSRIGKVKDTEVEHKPLHVRLLNDDKLFSSKVTCINFVKVLEHEISKDNKENVILLFEIDVRHKESYFEKNEFIRIFFKLSKMGQIEWMSLFLKYYRKFLSTKLATTPIIFEVVYCGQVKAAKVLIEAGTPINRYYQEDSTKIPVLEEYNGYMPLHIASAKGDLPMVEMLIGEMKKAKINLLIQTKGFFFGIFMRYTAIELSRKHGHTVTTQYLISCTSGKNELKQEIKRAPLGGRDKESKRHKEQKYLQGSDLKEKTNSSATTSLSSASLSSIKIEFNYKNFLVKHKQCIFYLPRALSQDLALGTLESKNSTAWEGFGEFCKDINRSKDVSTRLYVFNGKALEEAQIKDIQNFYKKIPEEYKTTDPKALEVILFKILDADDNPLSYLCKLLTVEGVKQLFFTYCQNFFSTASMYIAYSSEEILKGHPDVQNVLMPIPQSNTVTNIEFKQGILNVTILADKLEWIYLDHLNIIKKISFFENPVISIELVWNPKSYDFEVIAKTNSFTIARSFFRVFIKNKMLKLAQLSGSQTDQDQVRHLFLENSYRWAQIMDFSNQQELTELLTKLAQFGDQVERIDDFVQEQYKKYISDSEMSFPKEKQLHSSLESHSSDEKTPKSINRSPSFFQLPEDKNTSVLTNENFKFVNEFKQKLHMLMTHQDGGYTFQLKRPKSDCLFLQFTAVDKVLMMKEGIKKELIDLVHLLKQAIAEQREVQQYKVEVDWKNWTLSIIADTTTLNQIGEFLQNAGVQYFSPPVKISTILFYKTDFSKVPLLTAAQSEEEQKSSITCAIQ